VNRTPSADHDDPLPCHGSPCRSDPMGADLAVHPRRPHRRRRAPATVGGGAAGTALTMPVVAPLGDFAGVDRALVITTWGAAAGWLRLVVPVNAILIAGLALAKVSFDQYVRFIAPLMGILLIVILAVLLAGASL